jgi:predicted Zn-dependent peptidase
MPSDPRYHTLPNGIRLVHMSTASPVAHLGVFINAGTRDEPEGLSGLAHFLEHMIFKGTGRRKAFHILNRLESVGGELNAFTTKEYTSVYASFLNTWFPRASELLADIIFHSVFPDREIEKEKDIVIEEINSYKDTPSELIYDEFEGSLFSGHPMGRAILGLPGHVKTFNREAVMDFFRNHYTAGNMVICSVGGIGFARFVKYMEKYFNVASVATGNMTRDPVQAAIPFRISRERKTYQSHSIIGNRAFARSDERRFTFGLLNNILGGPGMNSRLNMLVREKYGYAYSIDSFYFPYSDTGVWGIYMGTDNGSTEKATALVMKELRKMRQVRLGSLQLSQAKKQYRGQIAMAFDTNVNVMLSGGRSFLYDKKLLSVKDIYDRIDRVTTGDLLAVADEVFDPETVSSLTYIAEWNS